MPKSIFGEKLIFEEPPRRPKGWYSNKAKEYIEQFLDAVNSGKCTTGMAKIPSNPVTKKEDKMRMYNAIKSLKRRGKAPVDVTIIEDDLWLVYEGD